VTWIQAATSAARTNLIRMRSKLKSLRPYGQARRQRTFLVILVAMTNDNRRHAGQVPLPSGRMTSGIVRRGDRLLRPMRPWSPAVHEYLRHLAEAGFEGSPRVLGTENSREVLTFIDGDVAMDPHWQPGHGHRLPPYARTDLALRGAAKLIRKLHFAAAGFAPAITSYRFHPRSPRPEEVVSPGDLGPWNTVYRDGIPVAFIDWDSAGPIDPLADLAAAAWTFVPLAPPGQLQSWRLGRPCMLWAFGVESVPE
jgi:hypothetical protein